MDYITLKIGTHGMHLDVFGIIWNYNKSAFVIPYSFLSPFCGANISKVGRGMMIYFALFPC